MTASLAWILWTATLADNATDFAALADPAYKFAHETPTRVPLSDWYWTQDGKPRGHGSRRNLYQISALWQNWRTR